MREELHIDLLDFTIDENNKESIPALFEDLSDPCKLVDALWILCRKEAEKLDITDESFGEALVGDPLEEAGEKFIEELCNFFPKSRGDKLRKMFGMTKQIEVKVLEKLDEKLDSPELQENIDRAVAGILSGNASG